MDELDYDEAASAHWWAEHGLSGPVIRWLDGIGIAWESLMYVGSYAATLGIPND